MPLALAILIVYAAILVALVALGWFVIPHLSDDVSAFAQHYPELMARVNSFLYDP